MTHTEKNTIKRMRNSKLGGKPLEGLILCSDLTELWSWPKEHSIIHGWKDSGSDVAGAQLQSARHWIYDTLLDVG